MASRKQQPNRHSRIRSDHASEVAEDYVEAIAQFEKEAGACRAVDLAKLFQVSHVTVIRTVERLQRDGYVTTEPYGPIELTPSGRELAERSRRRHETVLQFLLALGVSQPVAETDSEGIEHHVSPETLAAMQRFVDPNSRREREAE